MAEREIAQQRERGVGVHGEAEDIAANTTDVSPKPVAGQDKPELGSNAIVKLNMRHPFYREVYAKLLVEIEGEGPAGNSSKNGSIARLAQVGLDLLILAYARAEGMRKDPDTYYSDLRSYWGIHLKNMVQEWKKS